MREELNKNDADFLAIRSLFQSGNVKTMKLLAEQSPTKMAKALGLNYNSYLDKLSAPEKFTIKHILTIASLCKLDPDIIYSVIKNEVKM